MRSRWVCFVVCSALGATGCDSCSSDPAGADAGATAKSTASASSGLDALRAVPPERRGEVLAKVGDRVITLGEVIDAIEGLPPAERQAAASREGRRSVLDRMVRDALLAAEARRQGLHDTPELQDAVRGLLAEALLAEERAKMPTLAQIDEAEAKSFFEKHQDRYSHPELRRAEVLVFPDRASAARAIAEPPKKGWTDLGEISAKGHVARARRPVAADRHRYGDAGAARPSEAVDAPIVAALFSLPEVGAVHGAVVESKGKHYVVRLGGISAGRQRRFEEVSQVVRTDVLQERWRAREEALEKEARERFPVSIDEEALKNVEPPEWLDEVAGSRKKEPR